MYAHRWGYGVKARCDNVVYCQTNVMLAIPQLRPLRQLGCPFTTRAAGMERLGITCYVAKISEDNAPSLALFCDKLGFVVAKRLAPFKEIHVVAGPTQGLTQRLRTVLAGGVADGDIVYSVDHFG